MKPADTSEKGLESLIFSLIAHFVQRRGKNVSAVAVTNKNPRIA
jgi:hypothetical protein